MERAFLKEEPKVREARPLADTGDCFKRAQHASAHFMKRAILPVVALTLSCLASAASAVPGGKLQTLTQGEWTCELPGDATAMPVAKPELGFRIVPDSSYLAPDGSRGSYLLLADRLTLTSGAFSGRRFVLDGTEIMRELGKGDAQKGLRCVHAGPVNIATPG